MIYRLLILSFLIIPIDAFSSDAISHAPLGVTADHFHKKGEWMVSLRVTNMEMKNNIFNGNSIPTKKILNQPNPFASEIMNMGMAKMPKNLSVIPKKMTMKMVMLGAMYAPSDKVTLMGMLMFDDKEMTLDTHNGEMGRNYIGSFNTSSSDISKISFSGLYNLHESDKSRWHLILGLEQGLGENSKKGIVLNPMNMKFSTTLPYGMQISDKALRLLSGITNVTKLEDFIIGNQLVIKKIISEKNWNFGDEFEYNLWLQGSFSKNVSYSIRLNYKDQDSIGGRDKAIMAPVQTSNPNNYGGQTLNLGLGINTLTDIFVGEHKDRFSIEILKPIDQDMNGLQMKDDFTILLGFQKML